MKLYVMRHGPAEDQAASGVDADRALTGAGRERVRAVAKLLLDEGEEPANVLTSPLVRSVQTAEIVAVTTKLSDRGGTVGVSRDLAPGGSAMSLVRRLLSEGQRRVLLVGHEPDVSDLAETLLGKYGRAFDKATVLAVHLSTGAAAGAGSSTGDPARLRFVLDPKALRFDPDSREAASRQ